MRLSLLLAALVVSLGTGSCAKLTLSNEPYVGAIMVTGTIRNAINSDAVVTNTGGTLPSISAEFGNNVITGSVDSSGRYQIDGLPPQSSFSIVITNTDTNWIYESYRETFWTNNTGSRFQQEDLYLAPGRSATFLTAGANITLEVIDGWGEALSQGTLYFEYAGAYAWAVPDDLEAVTVHLNGTSTTTTVARNLFYPGQYNVYIRNPRDHNGIRLNEYTPSINIQDNTDYFFYYYTRNAGQYPTYPGGFQPIFIENSDNVVGDSGNPDNCTNVLKTPSGGSVSVTYTFKTPMLVNYFQPTANQNPNIAAAFGPFNCVGGCTTDWDLTGATVAVTPATAFTTPTTTVTLTISNITTVGTCRCALRFTNPINFYHPNYAGTAIDPTWFFRTDLATLNNHPGCYYIDMDGGGTRRLNAILVDDVDD